MSTVEAENSDLRWFALHVKPRYEKVASTMLRNKGYEEFLPLYRASRRWSDRMAEVDLPLFPGYIFCRFDPSDRRIPIVSTPGVLNIVGIGRTPVPLDEGEIGAIQAVIRSGCPAEPWPFLNIGDKVRIAYGSLSGVEGILVERKKQHRLVISVTLLQRSVSVEIDRNWIMPIHSIPVSRPEGIVLEIN
ncbi:MAG: UpxY family transcription antiterminator [Bryobacteraceae bacterium]|jgi:transcription antitermination factor NusG